MTSPFGPRRALRTQYVAAHFRIVSAARFAWAITLRCVAARHSPSAFATAICLRRFFAPTFPATSRHAQSHRASRQVALLGWRSCPHATHVTDVGGRLPPPPPAAAAAALELAGARMRRAGASAEDTSA
jgi:hypothetical protein